MKKIFTIIVLAFILITSGCTVTDAPQDSTKPKVYASFYAVYDFARMIGGDNIELECIAPPGAEPHDWEPSASDIARLECADLFVYSGGIEHWTDSVLPALSNKNVLLVRYDRQNGNDPHWWLSPDNAAEYMTYVRDALCKIDPDNASVYIENCKTYSEKAEMLGIRISDEMKRVQPKERDIVVSHEAYGYLCEVCGLNQIAVEGLSGESDPSPSRMAEIVKEIRDKNIKYIFTEPYASSKTIDTIAKEANVEILTLSPFEFDADGKDYFTVMEENLAALIKALG